MTKISLLGGLLLFFVNQFFKINAQTIGTWNSSSIQTQTNSAVGIGTASPQAWQEIQYCQNTQNGLIISKLQSCSPPGGGPVSVNTGEIWDSQTSSPIVFNPDENYQKFIPINFSHFPVLVNPSLAYSPMAPANLYGGGQPLIWARVKDPVAPNVFGTRFIVTPDGRVGINVASPRAPLDVRGSYDYNVPISIFGTNGNGFSRHLHMVANLGNGAYNNISRSGDFGLFYTDGNGSGNIGSNAFGSLVIAPWSTGSGVGGLRMDNVGNVEIRGKLRVRKVSVNSQWWPDFVFSNNYQLITIDSVESYININKHLPGIPAQDSIIENGQDIGEIQRLQQLKIEELTLYIIQLNKLLYEQRLLIEQLNGKLDD